MSRHARFHRRTPIVENLEERRLPSFFGSSYSNQVYYQAQIVRHEYDQYVSEVKRLELASRATPAEYLALRDDARAISADASAAGLPTTTAQLKAVSATLILDRAPLDGSFDNAAWTEVTTRLSGTLDGLHVPQTLIVQTVADMRTLADSAGVDPFGFSTFTDDFNTLRNGEQSLPANSGYHFEDPGLFYSQHLRGFFRGWGTQKKNARTQLDRDLAAIERLSPAGAGVIRRDASILESLSAWVPSSTMNRLNAAYLAAFAQGTPSAASLSSLRSTLAGILGPAATPHRLNSIGRLVIDAPALETAVADSSTAVQTIVRDVAALVDAGGGETLNPFRVTIQPGR